MTEDRGPVAVNVTQREEPLDGSPAKYVGETSEDLLREAVFALHHLTLLRFQVKQSDIGARNRVDQFAYVFRNDAGHAVRVVPLNPTGRRIQHNMKVVDQDGAHLVFLDSEFCRMAHLRYVEFLNRALSEELRSLSDEHAEIIGGRDLNAAFASTTAEEERAHIDEAVENVVDSVHGAYWELYNKLADLKRTLGKNPPPERVDALQRLERARGLARTMYRYVVLRRHLYIPFVLLKRPLEPITTRDNSQRYAFLRQIVRTDAPSTWNNKESKHTPWRQRLRAWKDRKLARLKWWFVESFTGETSVEAKWPIVSDTASYHMLLEAAKGCELEPWLEAVNFHDEDFQADHRGGLHASFTSRSIHVYRRGDWVGRYERQVRRSEHANREQLITTAVVRETRAVRVLFYLAAIFALFLSLATVRLLTATTAGAAPDVAADSATAATSTLLLGTLISATLAASIAMMNQTSERPYSERLLPARIALVAFALVIPAGIAVVGLWPTVTVVAAIVAADVLPG